MKTEHIHLIACAFLASFIAATAVSCEKDGTREEADLGLRSCLKFFLRTFEASFRAGFCRFLRRIAALFYDKNGENVPE